MAFDPTSAGARVRRGDRIVDPGGGVHDVLEISGQKMRLEDRQGDQWIVSRRRLNESWRLIDTDRRHGAY